MTRNTMVAKFPSSAVQADGEPGNDRRNYVLRHSDRGPEVLVIKALPVVRDAQGGWRPSPPDPRQWYAASLDIAFTTSRSAGAQLTVQGEVDFASLDRNGVKCEGATFVVLTNSRDVFYDMPVDFEILAAPGTVGRVAGRPPLAQMTADEAAIKAIENRLDEANRSEGGRRRMGDATLKR